MFHHYNHRWAMNYLKGLFRMNSGVSKVSVLYWTAPKAFKVIIKYNLKKLLIRTHFNINHSYFTLSADDHAFHYPKEKFSFLIGIKEAFCSAKKQLLLLPLKRYRGTPNIWTFSCNIFYHIPCRNYYLPWFFQMI